LPQQILWKTFHIRCAYFTPNCTWSLNYSVLVYSCGDRKGMIPIFPLAEIFFCRSACLSGQTGGGLSSRQTVQLGQNFRGLPNISYCSKKIYKNTIGLSTGRCLFVVLMSALICNCFGCEPVSPGFILPFCRYRPVQADARLPAWSSLPTKLKLRWFFCTV
jgi:hypothetical protein